MFIKDFEIVNENAEFPLIIGLNEAESSYLTLERFICALNNAGGGFIIVGTERKNNRVWANGINFSSNYELQEKENEIFRSMTSIKPAFEFSVKKVLVHTNFIEKGDILAEENRYCFRISVKPNPNKKYYVEILNKGYHTLYETY